MGWGVLNMGVGKVRESSVWGEMGTTVIAQFKKGKKRKKKKG